MPRLDRVGTLILMCVVYMAAGMTLASIGPSLTALAANVGQDVAVIGSQFSAFSLGTVLVQMFAPPLSARHGQRAVLALGALLMGGGILGESLSRALVPLLAFALMGGLGFGAILAAGSILIPQLFPGRSASALNLVNLFFGVGSIIGPLLAGWAQASDGTPLLSLWIGAGLLLALLPVISRAAEAAPAASQGQAADGVMPWRLIVLLGLLLLVYSGTEIAVGGWAAVYLEAGPGLSPERAAFAVAGFWLALTIGRGVGAALGLRLGALALLRLAVGVMLAGALLLALSVEAATRSVLALIMIGLACGPIFPTTMALIASVARGRSAGTSLALAIGNMGGALIPPTLGLVLSGAGPAAASGLVLALTIGVAVLLSLATLRSQKPEARSYP
jgi:MFS transporter, FHS family, L-fucose permease